MKHLGHILAGTGLWPRAAFGLAAAAALAAYAWPVETGPVKTGPAGPRAVAASSAADGTAVRQPLFDPGRRAWTGQVSRAVLVAGDPPRPVLTVRGLLLDGPAARVLVDDGATQTWLARGEGRDDWQVTGIAPDRITLAQGGRVYTASFLGPPVTLRPVGAQPAPPDAAPPALRP